MLKEAIRNLIAETVRYRAIRVPSKKFSYLRSVLTFSG